MLGQSLLLALAFWSVSASRVHLELGQRVGPPVESGWRVVRRCLSNDSVVLTFALKLRNVDQLEKSFRQISTPGSLKYRKHLSLEDLEAMTAPDDPEKERVWTWLGSESVGVEEKCQATLSGDFLECFVPCWLAEQLLDTQFFEYVNVYNDTVMRASKLYSVPSDVAPFIDFVGGTHRFPPTKRQKTHVSLPALGVTPHLLRQHYNVSDRVGKMSNHKQAVAQFLNQHFLEVDLKEFFLLYGESFTHKDSVAKIVGPNTGLPGVEASLDVQYIMSLGANISTWFWSTAGLHSGQEPFLEWIMAVGNTSDAPSVFSVSYGDDEDSLSNSYMERINQEFMKLGSRGISILFASGDAGTGCNGKTFVPSFPASSPYVTAVGGTAFKDIFGLGGPEIGNGISGGGFSAVFTQPSYQQSAVEKFLNTSTHLPDAKFYNKTGRAYPDISALSNGFWVVTDLIPMPVSGTSCSTPTVSGMISLINDQLLEAGKPVLGFLNPLLYSHSDALTDITDGCNSGCIDTGFCAQSGWDPVTGNGVVNYPKLAAAALDLSP